MWNYYGAAREASILLLISDTAHLRSPLANQRTEIGAGVDSAVFVGVIINRLYQSQYNQIYTR